MTVAGNKISSLLSWKVLCFDSRHRLEISEMDQAKGEAVAMDGLSVT